VGLQIVDQTQGDTRAQLPLKKVLPNELTEYSELVTKFTVEKLEVSKYKHQVG